ncbi:MAG: glycosyl hydrolase family 57, partial [Pseudomonadota bacterium]|nr:glycosyl hydrolase family 57 [Pseudomonadota bacterium]
DNGDPQFTKWFSWVDQAYSPDLNSWAVLTAFQNAVHTLEDCQPQAQQLQAIKRLLYTAETSCYWYWTGQAVWDQQVTQAVNHGMALIGNQINDIVQARQDKTAPTIFMPWIRPANPGGKDWGSGGLIDAASAATLYTFIYDVSGIARAILHCHYEDSSTQQFELLDQGHYPSQTNPVMIAQYYKRVLPIVKGRVRYFIEAWDQQQNVAYSSVGGIEMM